MVVADESGPAPMVYQVPLTYRGAPLAGADGALVGTSEHGVLGTRWVYDAPHDPVFVAQLLQLVQGRVPAQAQRESHTADPTVDGMRSTTPSSPCRASAVLRGEQSNTSVICEVVGDVRRRRRAGHRQALPGAAPRREPRRRRAVRTDRGRVDAGAPHGRVGLRRVDRPGERGARCGATSPSRSGSSPVSRTPGASPCARPPTAATSPAEARELGEATARIHLALAQALGTTPATDDAKAQLLDLVRSRYATAVAEVPSLADEDAAIRAALEQLGTATWPDLQRVHGDYHLGQVLRTPSGWVAVDFEGEPLRPLHERTGPDLALRDVAGMLRSFDYAGGSVELSGARPSARDWVAACREAFLDGYAAVSGLDLAHRRPRPAGARARQGALRGRLRGAQPAGLGGHPVRRRRPAPRHPWFVRRSASRTASPPRPPEGCLMKTVHSTAQIGDEGPLRAFLDGRIGQPHDFLGHHLGPGGLTITAYRPLARTVRARLADGVVMDLQHVSDGVWSGTAPEVTSTSDYRLLVAYDDGVEHEQDDPYRFAPTLGDVDLHLFNEGRHEKLWTVLGSHVRQYGGPLGDVRGVSFAVWAPAGRSPCTSSATSTAGTGCSHPMRSLGQSGVWELFIPGAARRHELPVRRSAAPTGPSSRTATRWRSAPRSPPSRPRSSPSRTTSGTTATGCGSAPRTTRTTAR